MYAFIILFTLQHSEAIKSPRLVQLQLMFVTILVSIEQHYWVHLEPLAVRIACFEDFRFEGFFEVTSLEELDVLIKLIKKIIWQSGSGGWQMCIKTSGSSKVKANVILILHALFLHQLCNAGPSLHLSTSFERQLLSMPSAFTILCVYWGVRHWHANAIILPLPGWFPSTARW